MKNKHLYMTLAPWVLLLAILLIALFTKSGTAFRLLPFILLGALAVSVWGIALSVWSNMTPTESDINATDSES